MAEYSPRVFGYDLLANADATVDQLGALEICGNYTWSISWCISGALPTDIFKVAVEYSNDGINWDLYSCCTVVDNCLKGGFFDSTLPFLWLRFNYNPETVQAGATIDARLILKIIH